MKIKDLAAMVANCRQIDLINTKDLHGNIIRQHLSLGGRAVFPLDGMQAITPETLLTIADVEEECRERYNVFQLEMNLLQARMVDDLQSDDIPAKMGKVNLETKYAKLISIHSDDGKETHFLPAAMLKPIKDARQLNLVIRKTEDERSVIVALDGIVHIATFATADLWADMESADELRRVWLKARALAEENELKKNEQN